MKRKTFIHLTGPALLSTFLSGSKRSAAQTKKRPNVVFILTDDQNYDTINALGNKEIITPNMDKLVNRGTSFLNTYIYGANSAAVCAPSRAMLMTGRNFFELPMSVLVEWRASEETKGDCPYITFPEVFRKAGYRTFGTGKHHNGKKIFARGYTDGAKIFFGGMHSPRKGGHLKPLVHDFDQTGKYDDLPYVENKFSSELFTDAAVQFLENYREKIPFMMYVAYTAPHDPRMAPQSFKDMYPSDKISVPDNFLPKHPFDNGSLRIRDERLLPRPMNEEMIRNEIGGYYAMITHLDDQIGRVLGLLEEKGLMNNTIIILAGDNGLAMGQHGLLGKQNLYQHSIGVPMVISGPGIPQNNRVNGLCYLHDLFPTLCDLIGEEIPGTVTSRSIMPLLENKTDEIYDAQFYAFTKTIRSVRKGDWKLIHYNVKKAQTTQLFNLKDDPREKKNLAENPEYKSRLSEMKRLLIEKGKEAGDEMILNFDF